MIDWIVFYAVSTIFQPYNGGTNTKIQDKTLSGTVVLIFINQTKIVKIGHKHSLKFWQATYEYMYFTSDFTSFDHVFILSSDTNVDGTCSVIYQTDLNVISLQEENEL